MALCKLYSISRSGEYFVEQPGSGVGPPALRRLLIARARRKGRQRRGSGAEHLDVWNAMGIPLQANRTNLVIVTATTTSWAPAFGGNTTFNDTLAVVSLPMGAMRATLALQGSGATLNWTGAYRLTACSARPICHRKIGWTF
jgi:hypothetical protein